MIKINGFEKSYGKKRVLGCDDISFDTGRISFLMAPNGAGKTTLLKCITALENYDGEIHINNALNTENLRDCFVIWDDCPFFNNLSGLKNLLILSEDKMKKEDIRKTALKYFDNEILKRKVGTYSYGQRKKLALVLAEILDPSVLIMDEISNGLDYDTMLELQGHLKKISKEGRTVLLTGHQLGFYEKIYDDLYMIKDGLLQKEESFERTLEEVYCEELH